jgi:hypothetical protein
MPYRSESEEKDRIGESQPFREQTFSLQDKIRPGRESAGVRPVVSGLGTKVQ